MKTRDHYLLLTVVQLQLVLLLRRSNSNFGSILGVILKTEGYRYFGAIFRLDKSDDYESKYLNPGSILTILHKIYSLTYSVLKYEPREAAKLMIGFMSRYHWRSFHISNSEVLPNEVELMRLLRFAPLNRITEFISDKVEMDLHYPTQKLTTPLIAAIDRGDSQILKCLMDRYSVPLDLTVTQPCGKTALMHASYVTRNVDILRVLVEKGADTLKIDIRGWNCLHYAIVGERMGNVEYLSTLGVNLNSQDEQGRTPLMIAVLLSNLAVVKFLIDHGADPRLTDNSGYTAFRLAILRKKQEQAALLIMSGSNVDCIPLTSTDSDYKLAKYLMPDLIPLNQ